MNGLEGKKQKEIQHQKEKIKREIGRNLDFPIFKASTNYEYVKQNLFEEKGTGQ